jgi:aminopeptidase
VLDAERIALLNGARRAFFARTMSDEIPWVGCQYPTPALAQEAGLATDVFADFLFRACLLDWDAEGVRMRRYAERFDAAETIRIVGEGTDITIGIGGRRTEVDAGRHNMPGGEFFLCPLEETAEGPIVFDVASEFRGREVSGVRLVFENGEVVDASAARGEDALRAALDTDRGARFLGELGIGCNPGITRPMRNTLFDEKIDGTIHLALGGSYTKLGGTNESAIHWDIVKDLRGGGRIELDGEVVQRDGRWLV